MKFKIAAGFIIPFLIFMASCNSQLAISNSPVFLTISTFAVSSIATPALTLTPSATFLPAQETEVVIPTHVLVADQTHQAFMFTAAPATLEARNVKCKDGFVLEMGLDVIRVSNNQWTLFTCSPKPPSEESQWTPGAVDYGKRYTQIIKTDLTVIWTIQHKIFDYSIIDRPDALLIPYRWTTDGRFLYLFPRYYPGPSGGTDSSFLITRINDLYRINLDTGDFELVLRGEQYGAFALSPNDKLLVYSEHDRPHIIHVKDMEKGADVQVNLNEDIIVAGGFVWNPESTMVVATVGYGKQAGDLYGDLSGTAIFVLNPKDMQPQKVLAKDARVFIPYTCLDNSYWFAQNIVCLYSINDKLDSWNKIFTLNLKTGEVEYLRPFP
jgi:hypothetical protein